jgi:DNA-binding NarL/FixJ family response regulator
MKLPRVLVADHHDQFRSLIVDLLSQEFQVVGVVAGGKELVRSAQTLIPDVIVTDIFMPQITGLSARDELLARSLTIPFVFLSALGKEAVEFVPSDEIVAFVYKIEMLGHLQEAIAAVLSGKRYLSPSYR